MTHTLFAPEVPKVNLKDVTLVCIDTLRPQAGANSIDICHHCCNFAATLFYTDVKDKLTSSKVTQIDCGKIDSLLAYNRFLSDYAWRHVQTTHMMLCQWDGFVIDPRNWDWEWMRLDFIGGSTHHKYWKQQSINSGGFSMRSVKLMKNVSVLNPFVGMYHEDVMITETLST